MISPLSKKSIDFLSDILLRLLSGTRAYTGSEDSTTTSGTHTQIQEKNNLNMQCLGKVSACIDYILFGYM